MRYALLFFTLLSPLVMAQAQTQPFSYEKTSSLPSGRIVSVLLRERICDPAECRKVDGSIWGVDSGKARFMTEEFRVSINGKDFPIPEKFYRDLTNTFRINVSEDKGQVVVELKGGEVAGAYTARFLLGNACGFERRVCGEVCGEIWERTTWHNSFIYESESKCKSGIK
jgi:hypothetical protein